MADDWQTLPSLAETNMHMLELEIMCDGMFLVGNEKQPLKSHKYMLVSRSPVFYAMFCGPMAESRDSIKVPDIEVECFKSMLRFIYTTDCLLTADIVMSVLYAAKKYAILGLVNKCKEYLISEISTENVCVILQQAHMFEEHDLLKNCLSFICKNGSKVLKSSGFLCLSKDTLQMILESDELNAPEEAVYTACVRWAEEDCRRGEQFVCFKNSREALGDLVCLIRFPCMNLDTFTSLVAKGSLLTGDENMSIVLQLSQNMTSKFNNKPRNHDGHLGNVLIERFFELGTVWHQGNADAISFTCNQNLKLAGVSLYTPCGPGKVKGKLECYDANDRSIISMDIELAYDSNITSVIKLFDTPVDIQKGSTYTLTQTLEGADTFSGIRGQSCVKKDKIEIMFDTSERSINGTSFESGQYHGLVFI